MQSLQKKLDFSKESEKLKQKSEKLKELSDLIRYLEETKKTDAFQIQSFVSGGSHLSVKISKSDTENPNSFKAMKDLVVFHLEQRILKLAKQLGYSQDDIFITPKIQDVLP